jgi:phosphatidylserine/phosphatidylglycerophosphate/cardiolipin synthase-like enzyme
MSDSKPNTTSIEMTKNDQNLPSVEDLSQETVTSFLACGPPIAKSPQDAVELLFSKPLHHLRPRINYEILEHEITEEELNTAAKFGRFIERPSELFLKLFHNVLCTLKRDPLCGCVSPSLIGTTGVIPLTIISTIPDIMQHYYHCIIHAKKEVLLATNFWEKSESVNVIGKALRDLSKRAGSDNRNIIVKLMIDHPTKENLIHYHNKLPLNQWSDYDIPLPEEIPNLSLEVINYHRMIMGTFHAKFMIIDRQIALLNSNNIQDRPNLEMMSHFEGDIVNSFYDTYLISWSLPFEPNLVCLKDEAPVNHHFRFGMNNTKILSVKQPLQQAIARARLRLQCHLENETSDVYLHAPLASEEDESFIPLTEEKKVDSNGFSSVAIKALVIHREAHSPSALVKATNNIVGGVIGYDMTPRSQSPLTRHLNKSAKSAHETKSDDNLSDDELEKLTFDFSPFIFHQEHKPFPIALVNRLPRGTPGHIDTANPQDGAWMGAFRYATKSIFIQSPTLNASPAIDGILSACRRGIVVTLWLDIGFNDSKEGFGTFQGGTNEHVVKKLYRKLRYGNDGAEKYLEVFWYTGKGKFYFKSIYLYGIHLDQTRPLNFSQKRRNCHIKFMSIDGQVAIMGNGNMDSQSWFHSQVNKY